MKQTKKIRRITARQLWFIWKVINELQAYLGNSIENGARGANRDYEKAVRAKEIIKQERKRIYYLKSKS